MATARFSYMHATVDGDYIYVLFTKSRGRGREGLAILEASGSDEYEYLSHITLYEAGDLTDPQPGPREIIVKDDLAIIGGDDQGMVYLVDVSEKDDPKLINKLILGNRTADDAALDRVTGLAIEDDVLFVSVHFLGEDESGVFAVDISNPEDTDEDDDLLDSYTLDDYEIYGLVSSPDYLYIAGKGDYPGEDDKQGTTILIMDASNPEHLSLAEVFDDLDDPSGGEPELSMAIAGDYLFVGCDVSEIPTLPIKVDTASKLRIIDISDPEDPELLSTSKQMTGTQMFGNRYIAVKDNYAYVLASNSWRMESRIYVYDVSDPADPDLIETERLSDGSGYDLHLIDDRLFIHISNQGIIKLIDISDPEDLSVEGAVDLSEILEGEEELDDWGYTGDTGPSDYVYGWYYPPSYTPSPSYGYGSYSPYRYSYSPPPSYTPYIPTGYNFPSRTSSGTPYYGYGYPSSGMTGFGSYSAGYRYGQPWSYSNYGPGPGFTLGLPPYYRGW